MASRADTASEAAVPTLGGAIRTALSDFYFNSWRLVPANVVWGAVALVAAILMLVWPVAGFVAIAVLGLPTAGVFRVAAKIVRGEPDVSFRDALSAWRDYTVPAVFLAAAIAVAAAILASNLVVGFGSGEPFGWTIGALAFWGLVIGWFGVLAAWPLLVDPARADRPVRDRLRLAGLLVLAHPGRSAVLGLASLALAVASAVLTAALLTVGVALIALIACRHVYPAADRLEARLRRVAA